MMIEILICFAMLITATEGRMDLTSSLRARDNDEAKDTPFQCVRYGREGQATFLAYLQQKD